MHLFRKESEQGRKSEKTFCRPVCSTCRPRYGHPRHSLHVICIFSAHNPLVLHISLPLHLRNPTVRLQMASEFQTAFATVKRFLVFFFGGIGKWSFPICKVGGDSVRFQNLPPYGLVAHSHSE